MATDDLTEFVARAPKARLVWEPRRLLLSLAAICGVWWLLWPTHDELAYFFSSAPRIDVGEVTGAPADALPVGAWVRVRGVLGPAAATISGARAGLRPTTISSCRPRARRASFAPGVPRRSPTPRDARRCSDEPAREKHGSRGRSHRRVPAFRRLRLDSARASARESGGSRGTAAIAGTSRSPGSGRPVGLSSRRTTATTCRRRRTIGPRRRRRSDSKSNVRQPDPALLSARSPRCTAGSDCRRNAR